ncbi:TPA: DUF4435 domain-containing protein [Vibrio cholerae]|uniref:DUF4435 domain-containing protein n=3 Tax=Vibrio cholerae TaxID=666 RepID=UPI0008A7011C|nr:DUF4435 domain-containing protein [Vibrio cholerae]AOY46139.1 hypothetical protein NH62_10920 [Vibrio cholerae]AOY49747.1 hypothetical protein AP033_10924 [Vibrio cholerae]MCX9579144.1 DUF4435 domain-containing protein [Vibrio cholerae]MCX9609362.1 DUF4435 domain-containing protein [Vibrio cholerae]NOF01941.1 DUF4435 domain-containing protein [Vibrio cholerae]
MDDSLLIPTRNEKAKFSRSVLTIDFNDIDIYIEDTKKGYQKIYIQLLSRLFKGQYKISDVHSIGPRSLVIRKCNEKKGKLTRPSLFIVDGDLFLLKGEEKPLPKEVFRLPRYSIENIILDEDSIIDYLDDEVEDELYEDIKGKLKFKDWVNNNKTPLIELFIHYSILQKHKIYSIQTINHKVSNLTKNDSENVDTSLIENKILECRNEILKKISNEEYAKELLSTRENITTSDCIFLTHISGKDYIFPLMKRLFKKVLTKDIATTNFFLRLAKKCPVDLISDCKNHIIVP